MRHYFSRYAGAVFVCVVLFPLIDVAFRRFTAPESRPILWVVVGLAAAALFALWERRPWREARSAYLVPNPTPKRPSRNWYYQSMGECIGPISTDQFDGLFKKGVISDDTIVRIGNSGKWVPAAKIRSLKSRDDSPRSQPSTVGQLIVTEPIVLPKADSRVLTNPPHGKRKLRRVYILPSIVLAAVALLIIVVLSVQTIKFNAAYESKLPNANTNSSTEQQDSTAPTPTRTEQVQIVESPPDFEWIKSFPLVDADYDSTPQSPYGQRDADWSSYMRRWRKLRYGMRKEEVRDALGEPTRIIAKSAYVEVWHYPTNYPTYYGGDYGLQAPGTVEFSHGTQQDPPTVWRWSEPIR